MSAETALHGIDYIMSLRVREDGLLLKLEEKFSGKIWKGDFSSKYIEDITQKTGNFKKFDVLVKMLASAIRNEIESVRIDVLTAQDLEDIKNRKAGSNVSASRSITTSTKRYLILTSTSEFDRVHYPLPLTYEESPEPETLKQTIARLSSEIESFRCKTASVDNMSEGRASFYSEVPGGAFSGNMSSANNTARTVSGVKEENQRLRRKLALLEKIGTSGGEEVLGQQQSYHEFDKYIKEAEQEALTLRSRLNETQQMLTETKTELFKTRSELGHFEQMQNLPDPESLKREIQLLTETLDKERKDVEETVARQSQSIQANSKELDKAKEEDKTLKARVKQLETELDATLKKANYSMYGSRNSSRPNSTSSRKSNGPSKSPAYGYGYNRNTSNKRSSSVPANQKNSHPNNSNNRRGGYNPTYNRKPTVPTRPNKFQPRYSPIGSRSNSGSKDRVRSSGYGKVAPRPSPGARSGLGNKVSPLRAANQARPKVPPAKKAPQTGGVFGRLYGGGNGRQGSTGRKNVYLEHNAGIDHAAKRSGRKRQDCGGDTQ